MHEEIGIIEMEIQLIGPNPDGIKADIYTLDGETYKTDLPDYGVLDVQGTTMGEDYILQTPFLFWAPGETGSKSVLIDVIDDKLFEADGVEWFNITIAPHCEGKRTEEECSCVSACTDHSPDFEILGPADQTIWVVVGADVGNEVSVDLNKDGFIDIIDRNILKNGWEKAAEIDEIKKKTAGLTAFTVDWGSTQFLP